MSKYLIIIISILSLTYCNAVPMNNKKDDGNSNLMMLTALLLGNGSPVSTINFQVVSSTQKDITCGTNFTTSAADTLSLKDLRFYVNDVHLIKSDGSSTPFTFTSDNEWQSTSVALLDFEDGFGNCSTGTSKTNTSLKGNSASGNFTGIRFTIGIPLNQNHVDSTTQSAPLNVTGMFWNWKGGYKFLKFDYMNGSISSSFHLGSGSCNGANNTTASTSCTYSNRPTIEISKSSGGTINFSSDKITLDLSSLLNGTTTTSTLSCMAGNTIANCKKLINNIGVKETDGTSLGIQTSFSIQ